MSQPANQQTKLSVEISGISMTTPLILASGCCGYGIELNKIEGFRWEDVGAVVLKSITLRPRLGKAPHRVAETPSGMLNAIGLQNAGVEEFATHTLPLLAQVPCPVIGSIIGETVAEYAEVARHLEGQEALKALEVNISSPNIERGGMEFGIDVEAAAKVTGAVRMVWSKPLWVKLSPQATDIAKVAEECMKAGADVISLINTLPAMAIDVSKVPPRPALGANMGGLSGPAIKPVAVRKVFEVWQHFHQKGIHTPIIGIGGIWDARDVLEFFAAGASAVQLGTVLFHNPLAPTLIAQGLKERLQSAYRLSQDESWLDIKNWTGSVALNA